MSAFIDTTESIVEPSIPQEHEKQEPYQVSPEDIYCSSLTSYYYNKRQVDDLVFMGMCNLYEKVLSFEDKSSPDNPRTPTLLRRSGVLTIPATKTTGRMEQHEPCRTQITNQSYTYTSNYKYNKFEVMIMEQNPERFGRRMYVRFTIVPKYNPSSNGDWESREIEQVVLDEIYNNVEDLFNDLEQEDYERANEKDEHSYQGKR